MISWWYKGEGTRIEERRKRRKRRSSNRELKKGKVEDKLVRHFLLLTVVCCLICFSFFYVHTFTFDDVYVCYVCVCEYVCVCMCVGWDEVCGSAGMLRVVSGQTPYIFVITSVLCKYFQLFASFLLLFQRTYTPHTHTHTCVTWGLRPFKREGCAGWLGFFVCHRYNSNN